MATQLEKITMKKYIPLLALLPVTASAADFSYTNFSIGYLNGSAELPASYLGAAQDLDLEGFQIDGQFEIANNFFGSFSYQDGDISLNAVGSLDYRAITVGLGGYVPLGAPVDLLYGLNYRYSDWDAGAGLDQSIGHITAHVGLRWSPVEWLEVNPFITHYFPVSDDNLLQAAQATYLEARLYITASEMFQPFVGVSYNIQEDSDNITGNLELFQAGLRISF